jgi:hypothetical protein
MKARATLASVFALFALTVAMVSIAASPAFPSTSFCGGTQGQPLLLGCYDNTESSETHLTDSQDNGYALHVSDTGAGSTGVASVATNTGLYGYGYSYGVFGIGNGGTGVFGQGDSSGVWGESSIGTGVYGNTTASGAQNGVYGHASDSNGSGVYGQNDGTGYGAAGVATNASGGTGLLGDEYSASGVGVEADSSGGGTALHVSGKAVFSRSGVVTVAAGKSSLVVTLSGVTPASMVLATSQQNKTVYVKAAVPGAGSFTIRLTGNAPTGGLKVAYFVLN